MFCDLFFRSFFLFDIIRYGEEVDRIVFIISGENIVVGVSILFGYILIRSGYRKFL